MKNKPAKNNNKNCITDFFYSRHYENKSKNTVNLLKFWGYISSFPVGHSEDELLYKRTAKVQSEYKTVSFKGHFVWMWFILLNLISGLSGVQSKAVVQSMLSVVNEGRLVTPDDSSPILQ